jgi:hypothetical protein
MCHLFAYFQFSISRSILYTWVLDLAIHPVQIHVTDILVDRKTIIYQDTAIFLGSIIYDHRHIHHHISIRIDDCLISLSPFFKSESRYPCFLIVWRIGSNYIIYMRNISFEEWTKVYCKKSNFTLIVTCSFKANSE